MQQKKFASHKQYFLVLPSLEIQKKLHTHRNILQVFFTVAENQRLANFQKCRN